MNEGTSVLGDTPGDSLMRASDPTTPMHELIELGASGSDDVRQAVACNPAAPLPLAEQFVVDLVGRATTGETPPEVVLNLADAVVARRKVSADLQVILDRYRKEGGGGTTTSPDGTL